LNMRKNKNIAYFFLVGKIKMLIINASMRVVQSTRF